MDQHSQQFIQALQSGNIETVRTIPKADLHNHFPLGGNRAFIKSKTSIDIQPFTGRMQSMDDMHGWVGAHLGTNFQTSEMRRFLIDAAFVQAKEDGVTILEVGEDVWGLDQYFGGDVHELISAFKKSQATYGSGIELRLQIGLSRHCSVASLEKWLEPFWGQKAFYSIDLCADELCQPIENFKPIYRKAKACGLRLKAHVGEWGTAEDVRQAVDLLELDEVQHGISAVDSKEVMRFLRRNNIRLNITPTSNVKLGRVGDMASHPIKDLYHNGIDVTINSDDVLIFDSDVSKEYMRLYESGTLSATDLNEIRINGLKKVE